MSSRSVLTMTQREDFEAARKPLSFRLIRRLLGRMRRYARRRNTLFALVILRGIQLPLLAWLIGHIIAGPVSRLDTRGVLLGALAYAALAVATQVTMRYRVLVAQLLGEDIINDLRQEMFDHLQRLPMKFFNRTPVGRVISRFTSDAEAVRAGVQNVLFVSMVQIGQMLIAAVLMLSYDAFLFLFVLGVAPILWGLNVYFRRRLSQAYRAMQESFSRITATLAESVSGIRVVQGFVRQDVNAGLFHDLVADHSSYNIDAARSAGIFIPLLTFNAQLFVAIVLMVGGWRALHGLGDVESLYQFLLMSNLFFSPIQSLGVQYNSALTAMAGAERVFRLLDTKPDWADPPDAVSPEAIRGRIEFRNVTFEYNAGEAVLQNVNVVAEPGQTVALVGHTGSGKTTITNLIAKFYLPTQGEIFIDEHEIRTLAGDALHRHTGIVWQQNFLFSGSVMDNIRFGRPAANDEDILAAIRRLDCLDILEMLPDGLQTIVSEGGGGISLGQRQLICFARAMLADPKILILDEATSSVDTMTEARIQKSLTELLKNRTSIVVAHRLSTIRDADLVLVLDRGRIAERGTHQDLLVAQGVYADLYRQFVLSAEGESPSEPTA